MMKSEFRDNFAVIITEFNKVSVEICLTQEMPVLQRNVWRG